MGQGQRHAARPALVRGVLHGHRCYPRGRRDGLSGVRRLVRRLVRGGEPRHHHHRRGQDHRSGLQFRWAHLDRQQPRRMRLDTGERRPRLQRGSSVGAELRLRRHGHPRGGALRVLGTGRVDGRHLRLGRHREHVADTGPDGRSELHGDYLLPLSHRHGQRIGNGQRHDTRAAMVGQLHLRP